MPITFEEMVQAVINTVKEREEAWAQLRQAVATIKERDDKIKELEAEVAKLNVRDPDKKSIIPLKELK